jgi:DNA ligase-4
MPFPFTHVCDLLQRLDGNRRRKTPHPQEQLVGEWFAQHKDLLGQPDFDLAALLSALLSEKRTDRVYNIREKKLQGMVAKAQFIGKTRMLELGRWENPGSDVDLADCVESLLNATVCNRYRFLTALCCQATTTDLDSRIPPRPQRLSLLR